MCSFRGCSSTGFTQKAGLDRHNKNATFWHCPTKRNQLLQESTLSPDVYTCSSLGATVATRYSYLSRWGCPALHSVEVAWYESPSGASPAQFLMAFPLMFLPCARLRGRDFSRCLTHLAPPPPSLCTDAYRYRAALHLYSRNDGSVAAGCQRRLHGRRAMSSQTDQRAAGTRSHVAVYGSQKVRRATRPDAHQAYKSECNAVDDHSVCSSHTALSKI